jgi:hypothetical protein
MTTWLANIGGPMSEAFADGQPGVGLLGAFGGGVGTVVAGHVVGTPTEHEHEVTGVAAGELSLVGEAVPPSVGVHVRHAGASAEQVVVTGRGRMVGRTQ